MDVNPNEIQIGDVYTDPTTGTTAEVLYCEVYPIDSNYIRVVFRLRVVNSTQVIVKCILFPMVESLGAHEVCISNEAADFDYKSFISLGMSLLNASYWTQLAEGYKNGFTIH